MDAVASDLLRQRLSPLVVICEDEFSASLYPNVAEKSFIRCLKAMEHKEYLLESNSKVQKRLFLRLRSVEDTISFNYNTFEHQLRLSCVKVDEQHENIVNSIAALNAICLNGVSDPRLCTSLDHPVACIHVTTTDNADPLNWFLESQHRLPDRLHPLKDKIVSPDILHYFVLVRKATSIGGHHDTRLNDLVSEMCRHFGHNTSQIIIHEEASQFEDLPAWELLLTSFVRQSLAPFMENFINSSFDLTAGSVSPVGFGFASRIFSVGRRWLASPSDSTSSDATMFESATFLMRRAAMFACFFTDWETAGKILSSISVSNEGRITSSQNELIERALISCLSSSNSQLAHHHFENVLNLARGSKISAVDAVTFLFRLFGASSSLTVDYRLQLLISVVYLEQPKVMKSIVQLQIAHLFETKGFHRHCLLHYSQAINNFASAGLVIELVLFDLLAKF